MRRRARVLVPLAVLLAAAFAFPPASGAAPPSTYTVEQRALLRTWAADTWESFVAMTNEETGLTSDNLDDVEGLAEYTSPTNIGMYFWAILAARDLQIITPREAIWRLEQTLETLATLERSHGQFYNWYDPATGDLLTTWPTNGDPVYPFLSTVDNGWLAAALIMVARAVPQVRDEANAILEDMNFGFYYDPAAGLLRGGAWTAPPPGCSVAQTVEGEQVYFTCHHYGALNTEPRIASYIGIAMGDVPATHYFKMWRTFPDTCDWSWQEMKPEGVTRTYLGVDVFEGTYEYRDMRIVPSWGGSMFEALMVPLIVPEEEWGTQSWAINHPLYVEAQIEHGLEEADYGYWGFSPSSNPPHGYREFGVDAIGLEPNGYASDLERTYVDYGFEGCRPGAPLPTDYGQGIVTPHAVFLALEYDPAAAFENLANLAEDFGAYGDLGWYDAVNVETGELAARYLALDQGMIMAAIANALTNDRFQTYFTKGAIEDAIRPLLAIEEFEAGRIGD